MKVIGRPKTREIDDNIRPAAEKGLPIGEIRYSTVYNIEQLQKVKYLVGETSLISKKKKVGNVPAVQFKNLIFEALTDLLKKYEKKKNTVKREKPLKLKTVKKEGRGRSKANEALLKKYLKDNPNR